MIIDVEQKERIIRPPSFCECGNKAGFTMSDKKMYDMRWLTIEEPFDVATVDRPGTINIYLKNDLTTPEMHRRTDPGNRLKINGIVKEIKKYTKMGAKTQLDIFVEANHVEPTEIEWEEVNISPDDERKIIEMAADPEIYKKIIASIATSMYGMDEVKEAIAYQLFGGVPQHLADGTRVRGDIHILLLGDPSVGKSVDSCSRLIFKTPSGAGRVSIGPLVDKYLGKSKVLLDGGAEVTLNTDGMQVLALDPLTHKAGWAPVTALIRHKSPEYLYKITTRSGRQVTGTEDHSFLVLDSNGEIISLQGGKLKNNMCLPIPLGMHAEAVKEIDISKYYEKRTNARAIKTKIALNKDFGFFLGLFLAEGSLTKGTVYIDSISAELKSKIAGWTESININSKTMPERIFASSRSFCRFLEAECYFGEKIGSGKGSGSRRKCVPDFAYFAPKEFVSGLLSGLFSGDGYFTDNRKCEYKSRLMVGLSTTSKNLAEGALELLAGAGIFAKVREKKYIYKGETRKCWEILMTGPAVEAFNEKIGIVGKKPKSARVSQKDELDSLPCGELLYSIVKELGYSKRLAEDSEKRRSFAAMMRTVRARNKIGRRRLERVYSQLAGEAEKQGNGKAKEMLSKLEKILASNVVWDPIVGIEKVKPESDHVYDLSVDGKETFVANGIAVHNTQLLKLVSKAIPRGRYVSGKGVTGVGLTASVTKDEEFMGGWVLEAGAMVLCHKGLLAIDEFDKMHKDDQIAMHEAMSTQTISIAKATIVATLPAQTAVLAGANPKYSRFDPYKSTAEQTDIPDTLLSRFDLKFALRDIPDRATDDRLATHIMDARLMPDVVKPVIDTSMMRKYIAYTKHNCFPKMTPEAAERIKNFYITMRNMYAGEGGASIPITLRQYEALIRLAEAAAKIRLSNKVEVMDAERVIKIMEYSIKQLGFDTETGKIDIDKTEGVSSSQRGKLIKVIDIIEKLEKTIGKPVPIDEVKAAAQDEGVSERDVDDVVQRLKKEGVIFEPRTNFIQKV
jgi:replicative DNA helicase Mcm